MSLSAGQIAQVAAAAGFTGNDLVTAVAIALAESGGNPSNYNSEPQDVPGSFGRTSSGDGKGSYGLWQIYLAAHPEFAGANLLDPQTNANAAFAIYAIAGGFHPWSTYTSGEYGMYETPAMLAAVMPSAPLPPSGGAAQPAPLVLDASTGQPIVSATPTADTAANLFTDVSTLTAPSMTDWLLIGGLGLAALWLVSEA